MSAEVKNILNSFFNVSKTIIAHSEFFKDGVLVLFVLWNFF